MKQKRNKQVPSAKERPCKINNPVAKFSAQINKSQVHVDKRKASRRGYQKHKGQTYAPNTFPVAVWQR